MGEFVGSGSDRMEALWLDTFSEHLRKMVNPSVRSLNWSSSSTLSQFIQAQGANSGVVTRNRSVIATRFRLLADGYTASTMLSLRATIAGSGLGGAAFAYSPEDVYLEQDAMMMSLTVRSLLYAVPAVLFAVMLLSVNVGFMLSMSACVLSCCIHMIGWMVLTGTKLSAVSLIPLLMSIGLCIDYCTHICHAFWESTGSSSERAAASLSLRGAAVANGGMSTAVSQLLLAASKSCIFMTFCKMMLGVVVVGQFHALLVLPVVLSLMPGFGSGGAGANVASASSSCALGLEEVVGCSEQNESERCRNAA